MTPQLASQQTENTSQAVHDTITSQYAPSPSPQLEYPPLASQQTEKTSQTELDPLTPQYATFTSKQNKYCV